MNVQFDEIRNHLLVGYQFVKDKTGLLAHHSVKAFDHALFEIRQDVRLAILTVAITNVIFIKTICLMTSLTDQFFMRYFGQDEGQDEGRNERVGVKFVILTMISSLLVGMNVVLYRKLQSPLSPLASAAVVTATCAGYIFFHL